jgi:DNA-binding response OmpR family regulator
LQLPNFPSLDVLVLPLRTHCPVMNNGAPLRRILVADDDARIREMLREAVTDFGYDVDVAPDGRTALTKFTDRSADLVITDLMMPGLNGLQLAAELRVLHPGLPIILITGLAGDAELHEARSLGLRIVHKPIGLAALKAAIDAALGAA